MDIKRLNNLLRLAGMLWLILCAVALSYTTHINHALAPAFGFLSLGGYYSVWLADMSEG